MKRVWPRSRRHKLHTVWFGGCRWELKRFVWRTPWRVDEFHFSHESIRLGRRVSRCLWSFTMLKPNQVGLRGTGKLANDDPDSWKGLPGWRAFFLDQTYGLDLEEREPGVLIVRPTAEGWAFTLKEPSLCLMLKVCGRTWDESVLLAEALLTTEGAPWEADSYEQQRRAKIRKRTP